MAVGVVPRVSRLPWHSVRSSKRSNTCACRPCGLQLGEGSFGDVKLGQHKVSKEMRAIKIIAKDKLQSDKDAEALKQGALTVGSTRSRLMHAHRRAHPSPSPLVRA